MVLFHDNTCSYEQSVKYSEMFTTPLLQPKLLQKSELKLKCGSGWALWYVLVVPATWEAEQEDWLGLGVGDQPGQHRETSLLCSPLYDVQLYEQKFFM